jgi:hypothetical protein
MEKRQRVIAPSVALPPPKKVDKTIKTHGKLSNKPTVTARLAPKPVKAAQRYELWHYDEYGAGTIIFSNTDLEKVVERARTFVSSTNVENALAFGEQDKQWETYFVEFIKNKKPDLDILYAGNKKDGRHYIYARGEDGKWQIKLLPKETKYKFFLGSITRGRAKEPWYLADHKGNEITDLGSSELERKAIVFVKVL